MRLVVVIPTRYHVISPQVEEICAFQTLNMTIAKSNIPPASVALTSRPDSHPAVIFRTEYQRVEKDRFVHSPVQDATTHNAFEIVLRLNKGLQKGIADLVHAAWSHNPAAHNLPVHDFSATTRVRDPKFPS